MWNRFFALVLFVTLLLVGSLSPAYAQDAHPYHAEQTNYNEALSSLTRLLNMRDTPPVISNLHGPRQLAAGQEGLFSADTNVEAVALPLRAKWHFSDGSTQNGLHVRHCFQDSGTYVVTFTLANDVHTARDSLLVTVSPSGAPQ